MAVGSDEITVLQYNRTTRAVTVRSFRVSAKQRCYLTLTFAPAYRQLLGDRVGFVARDAVLDRLGRAVDERFGFGEAERRDFADGLDDMIFSGPASSRMTPKSVFASPARRSTAPSRPAWARSRSSKAASTRKARARTCTRSRWNGPARRTAQHRRHDRDGAQDRPRLRDDGVLFYSLDDNLFLDTGGPTGPGYAVFGKVIRGADVARTIQHRHANGQLLDPPVRIVRISRIR